MWIGELTVEDRESFEAFFDELSLVPDDQFQRAIDELDGEDVDWPVELYVELDDETWSSFANRRPEEAEVLERQLEHVPEVEE